MRIIVIDDNSLLDLPFKRPYSENYLGLTIL